MLDTPRLRRWLVITALLSMAASNGIILWNTRSEMQRGYGDFLSSYTAGIMVRRGLGSELYNPLAQWKVQQEFAPEVRMRRGPLCYMRPPFEALLFAVFAIWPYATALLLWTGVKLALLAAIPFIVVRERSSAELFPRHAVLFLFLGTFPVFMDLLLGQDAPLLAFLLAISFRQLATNRDRGAGFILGLALFKFHLVIPLVVMLWIGGRKRILPGFALCAVAVLAISGAIVGWKGLLNYPRYLLALSRGTGVGIAAASQITLHGLLAFFAGRLRFLGRVEWVLAPVALGAILYTGILWRRAGERWLAECFGLATIVAIITNYYANDYDLLLLIVPLLAMLGRQGSVSRPDCVTRYLEMTGLVLLFLAPVYWLAREKLQGESLMVLPLLAVALALGRRLSQAGAAAGAGSPLVAQDGLR